ncbi:MAG: DcrB-related protein [Pseudomonadota bacterium]
MRYQINEGSFAIPAQTHDRSVNMLALNLGPGGFTLVLTRDQLPAGEELDAFLTRQLRTLGSQVKQFKQQDKIALRVGPQQLPALQVGLSFKQNNSTVHQLQTVLVLSNRAVLVITVTCAAPLTAEQTAAVQHMLDSFTPAAAPSADSATSSGPA